MELTTRIQTYRGRLEAQYGRYLLPAYHRALDAITRCRTPASGEVLARCSDCGQIEWHPCSCGHRSCPRCQNHEVTQWLERQRGKLLPVDYFLVTFTLPAQLRSLAWQHQHRIYAALFRAARETLRQFGLNPKHLGAERGMTAVLHTHSRRLTYHPHLHVVVPGGGVDVKLKAWKRTRYRYLFNEFALAAVFRGKLLHEIDKAGLRPPTGVPKEWVVDCKLVGRGESAREYLSRYLYRGVIRKSNIIADDNGQVTFRYTDGESGKVRTESLLGEAFLWRLMQHILPRGFHRVRDYGFLHHNARKTLQLVQLILQVVIKPGAEKV
ncbi:MAG: transposase [Candidatus Thiodiazotropha sp. (ex Lucinoma kastoroae)]|nr:transposase [Candidatus Thiodiazotropha sp. (ex Lucinoma kastoroae)]